MNSSEALRLAKALDPEANYILRSAGYDWHVYHLYDDPRPTRYLGLMTFTLDTTNREPEPS